MEILKEFRALTDAINIDGAKFIEKDNRKAALRIRNNANSLRKLLPKLRKEILDLRVKRENGIYE